MSQDQTTGEDEGLELGYSGTLPEAAAPQPEPQPEPAPQPEADKQPEQKPESTTPAEPTESEALKLAKTLDGRFRNLTGDFNKFAARLDELATKLTPSVAAAATAAAKAEGADTPTQQQVTAALKDGAKMAALREEFPDWADAINEAVAENATAIEERIMQRMPKAEAADTANVVNEVVALKHLFIEMKHSSWTDTVKTPEFSEWLDAQPDDVRKLAESESPKDAISLLDKFNDAQTAKASQTQKPDPKTRLTAAAVPRTGANRPPAPVITEDDALAIGYQNAV